MLITEFSAVNNIMDASSSEFTVEKLIHAVQWGDYNFVENAIDTHGMSPESHDSDYCTLLHWAAINNRIDIAKYLISKNAKVNAIGGRNKEIPIQWALRSKNCTTMVHLLISEGADIHHKSSYGCDCLFIAVQCDQLSVAFILLNAGADPNTVDVNNDTPLYWLLRKQPSSDTVELQRLLLRFNASVLHKAKDGNNALHILSYAGKGLEIYSAQLVYLAGINNKTNGNSIDDLTAATNSDNLTPYKAAQKTKNSTMIRFLYDAYLYTNFPYSLSIYTTALTLAAFFVCFHFGGWLYGILAFIPVYCIGDLFSQSNIITAVSRTPCGGAWGIIISVTSSYFIYLSSYYQSSICDIVVATNALLIAFTLVKTTITIPLHLYGDTAESRNQLVEKIVQSETLLLQSIAATAAAGTSSSSSTLGLPITTGKQQQQLQPFRFCTTCLIDKSQVSMHCSKCNICVVSLDHHCPFVCNCVGRGNRRMFVYFLITASFGCALFAILSLWAQYHNPNFCSKAAESTVSVASWIWGILSLYNVERCMLINHPSLALATWLSGCTSIWIFAILIGQLALVASETTTFEVLKHNNNGMTMWSLRAVRNIIMFFSTGTYSIVSLPSPLSSSNTSSCSTTNTTSGSGSSVTTSSSASSTFNFNHTHAHACSSSNSHGCGHSNITNSGNCSNSVKTLAFLGSDISNNNIAGSRNGSNSNLLVNNGVNGIASANNNTRSSFYKPLDGAHTV